MDWVTIWTGLGGILGGSAITHISSALIEHKRQKSKDKLEAAEQPFQHLNSIITRLEDRLSKVEGLHTDCLKEQSILQRQIGGLEGQVTEQRQMIQHLQQLQLTHNRRTIKKIGGVATEVKEVAAQAAVNAATAAAALINQQQSPSDSGTKLIQGVDDNHPLPVKVMKNKEE